MDVVGTYRNQEQLDKRSKAISVGIHLLLLLIAFWPMFEHWSNPLPETVVIEFVELVAQDIPQDNPIASSVKTTESAPKAPAIPDAQKSQPAKVTTQKKADIITEERQEISASKAKVVAAKPTKDFGSLFGQGSSESTHEPSKKKNLSSLSSVGVTSSKIGQGLSGRQIAYAPKIEDNSQKTGLVVVDICVDQEGKVMTAKYTQRGSTTNDQYLIQKAVKAAKKWRFATSAETKQCGVINIDFKLK